VTKPSGSALAVLVVCAGLLLLHAAHFLPFFSDDALISLRYARRLLDGHGLTWTDGRPVEGYSNLLWILTVAIPGAFGVDLVLAARVLGVVGMAATPAALWFAYARRARGVEAWFPMSVGGLFLALGAPIAVWAIGGLEQPLFGALIAASVPLVFRVVDREGAAYRAAAGASLALGLACLTRPDGPIFAATAAASVGVAGWLSRKPKPVMHAALILALPIVFTAGQLLFRLAYYGEFVPNTALVKISGSASHWRLGVEYLSSGFQALFPWSTAGLVALGAVLISRQSRARGLYLVLAAAAWAGYVAFIGGDNFPAYRHFVPLMVLVAFALAEAARLAARQWPGKRVFHVMAVIALLAFVPYVRGQAADKWVQRAITERWEWQGKEVALTLKQAFGTSQPLMAVTAAGCLPYWSELPSLDMMGLSDYYLPRHRPPSFGTGMVGHELGDAAYILERNPDLIIFDVGSPQPSWRSGDELNRRPEFHARYAPVTIRTQPSDYSAVVFINKYSDRIGVQRAATTMTVPGFLFTGKDAMAVLDERGALVARVLGAGSLSVTLDTDEQMRWAADVPASGLNGLALTVELEQDRRALSVTLRLTGDAGADIPRLVLRGESVPSRRAGPGAR
jgi:hypothetical protein